MAYEYLNTMLWESFPDYPHAGLTYRKDPKISAISEDWQREKSSLLGLTFQSAIPQPTSLIGKDLGMYKPQDTFSIKPDGNCLYRCLSAMITGCQDSHLELRATIARFIASEGTTQMSSYFKENKMTPDDYLTNGFSDEVGIWGTDVEIVAASTLLKTDIYIANEFYIEGEYTRRARWHLYTLNDDNNKQNAIFISNFGQHFTPVISMTNSCYPTYGENISIDVTAES